MHIETLRMIEAVLTDGTLGVNAQIDALTLDTPNGGTAPDTRPAHVTVKTQADSDPAVREQDDAESFPLVMVYIPQPINGQGQVWSGIRDAQVDVIVCYVTDGGTVPGREVATDYSLRAIVRSISAGLFAADKRDTAGTRNGYVISKASRLQWGPSESSMRGGVMRGAVQFTLTVRDTNP